MKRSILSFIILTSILAGCSTPQVTVTPEATITLTPPPTSTSTSVPTPTATPVTANMSELDQQIFDAAPEIEGVEKVMHNLWGVVGVDEKGEITHYWDYLKYNYDRGDWREVVREENDHLVILNAKGEEQIVYPERITINVNGEELVLNTTARGYLENRIPDTPGAKLAIAQELIRLSDEGNVLPKLADDGMTLQDFWVKETFGNTGKISPIITNNSTDWEEQRPDQLPSTFVLFPHVIDGKVIDEVYDVFTLVKQLNKITSGFWSTVVNANDKLSHPQQILDNDVFRSGGKSIVTPIRYRDKSVCVALLGLEMSATCDAATADQSAAMQAFRNSITNEDVDQVLLSGDLTILADLLKVAK